MAGGHSSKGGGGGGSKRARGQALKKIVLVFVIVQACSFGLLYYLGQPNLQSSWLLGLAGPIAHAKTLPPLLSENLIKFLGLMALSALVVVIPWMYAIKSNWRTFLCTVVGWSLWTAYGIGFTLPIS
jgi:hypothetical protein